MPYDKSEGNDRDFVVLQHPVSIDLIDLGLKAHLRSGVQIFVDAELPAAGALVLGVASLDGRLVRGPALLPPQSPDAALMGQCAVINIGIDSVDLFADHFGGVPIYVARMSNGLAASNRLPLLISTMARCGEPVDIDLVGAAALLVFQQSLGKRQNVSRTPIKGIELLRYDAHIVFRRDSTTVRTRPDDRLNNPDRDTCTALIETACDEILSNVAAVFRDDRPVRVRLTGGQDSRLVLSAVMALGKERNAEFITFPFSDDDTAIASGLVKAIGGRYWNPQPGDLEPRTLAEAFAFHRRTHFGLYNWPKLRSFWIPGPREGGPCLGGGFGENYKADSGFPPFSDDTPVEDAVACLIKAQCAWTYLPVGLQQPVRDLIFSELAASGGQTLREQMFDNAANFGNRLHFGRLANAEPGDRWTTFSPLVSPGLFRLTRSLPGRVTKGGRLIFEVMRRLSPDLVRYPSNSPFNEHNPDHCLFDGPCPEPDLALHPAPDLIPPLPQFAKPYPPEEVHRFFAQQIDEACEDLRGTSGDLSTLITPTLEKSLAWVRSKPNHPFMAVWASRLCGLADLERWRRNEAVLAASAYNPSNRRKAS